MSRFCLTVGLFLGLLARSFHPLAAADGPPANDPGHRQVENPSFDPSDVPLLAPAVRQAMQDRNYAEARKAIDEAAKAKDAPVDYLAYLRAWSFQLEKQPDQAIAALEKFEKDFPQSTWRRRARFAKAQAMVAKSDFRGAAATVGGRLSGVCRRPVPAPPRGPAARLQERAGVLCPCPRCGPAGPATCGGRVPHRLLFAEIERAGGSGEGL